MKKIILSATAFFTIGFAQAQNAEFGLKGGLNIANQKFTGDGSPTASSIVGVSIGAFVDFKISDTFSIQPELLYSTKGCNFNQYIEIEGTGYNTDATFNLSYIDVPVMFKYYAAKKLSFEAGPQISFLTSAETKVKFNGISGSDDSKEFFKSIDFGLNLGMSYEFTKKLSAGIRYGIGLANTFDNDPGDNSKAKNNVFSLFLGYKL